MEIVWSKLAYEHFLEILIYVENNFGMLTAQKTRQKIQDNEGRLWHFGTLYLFARGSPRRGAVCEAD